IFTFLIVLFYGLFDEVHQIFIPGRFFDWWDLVANGVGSLLGIILVKVIIIFNQKKDANLLKLS
ncbi:MAG: VanZ family protein, partial [Bacteroidetes bacterium]|nr:VanZ family protein [Bacteroidota bacterium]MBU1800468.1 VanZ family protein [Bacteroidota bacterium]